MKASDLIRLTNILQEDIQHLHDKGVGLDNEAVKDDANAALTNALSCCFVTPYVGLERVAKVLAYYHIHIPKAGMMEDSHGFKVFEINQFGEIVGMTDKGTVETKTSVPYKVYFEWQMNDKGRYDIFCELVDEEELSELIKDVEEEMNDEDADDDREERLDETTETQKKKVSKVMGEFKRKKLHSGSKKGPLVKDRKQAIAIALNQAGLSKIDEAFESDKFWDTKANLSSTAYTRQQKHMEDEHLAKQHSMFLAGAAAQAKKMGGGPKMHNALLARSKEYDEKSNNSAVKARIAMKWREIGKDKNKLKNLIKQTKKRAGIKEQVASPIAASPVLNKTGTASNVRPPVTRNIAQNTVPIKRPTSAPPPILSGIRQVRPISPVNAPASNNLGSVGSPQSGTSTNTQAAIQAAARAQKAGIPPTNYRSAQETGMDNRSQSAADALVRGRRLQAASKANDADRNIQSGGKISGAPREVSSTLPLSSTAKTGISALGKAKLSSRAENQGPGDAPTPGFNPEGPAKGSFRASQEVQATDTPKPSTVARVGRQPTEKPEPSSVAAPAKTSMALKSDGPSTDLDRSTTTPRGVEYTPRTTGNEKLNTAKGREQFWDRTANQGG